MPFSRAARPTWAEISLTALVRNFRQIQKRVGRAEPCLVVKCDAYGHGSVPCARALVRAGACWFAVSSPEEGIELRRAGIDARILVLSGFFRDQARDIVANDLTPNIWEPEHIRYLSSVVACGAHYPVHVEIDTGMSRQGVPLAEVPSFFAKLRSTRNLSFEGVMQHYAEGEDANAGSALKQESLFAEVLSQLRADDWAPQYIHMLNSGASVARPQVLQDARFASPQTLARTGLALYGYALPIENNDADLDNWHTTPVLSWKTRVISVRKLPTGTGIGYSGAYHTSRPSVIASVPVGYGDGLNRLLSSRGHMLVRGEYAPIVGNISMDVTTIDVTDIPGVSIGDEVVLLGTQGERSIDAWEHAELSHTIPYEILCGIGPRVPRSYTE